MDKFLGALVVGAVAPFFWLLARSALLWAFRRMSSEWWATAPITAVIARLANLAAVAIRAAVKGSR